MLAGTHLLALPEARLRPPILLSLAETADGLIIRILHLLLEVLRAQFCKHND